MPTVLLQLLKKDVPINMKRFKSGFTLIELLVVITIIGILSSIGLNTFTSSQKKGRDTKRKGHLRQLTDALEAYNNDFGEYPDDDAGRIVGCGDIDSKTTCIWGTSVFQNDDTETVYMILMPEDPSPGNTYYYESFTASGLNTKFQLYARLENDLDIAVPKDIDSNPQNYGISCGVSNCNYGVSSSNMTVEEGRTIDLD